MSFSTFLYGLYGVSRITGRTRRAGPRKTPTIQRRTIVPRLEVLEDRTLLSGVSFSSPVGFGVGAESGTVAVADFNGDGKLDLAAPSALTSSVSVMLGNGDGTFQTAHNYTVGRVPQSVAVGDFNGDGKLDLAVANEGGASISVLLGNGDGTFQAAQSFAAGQYPKNVVVGDFNGDGKADLVVGNIRDNTVSLLLGNGDGTFQAPRSLAVGAFPNSVAVGDFNGDGKLDLAVANFESGTVSILLGNGDGTFQPAHNYSAGNWADSVAVGDFNGDGKLDLAVANEVGPGTVHVLLGNGDGTFQPAQSYATGSESLAVAVGDINGDGKLDLAVANLESNNVSVLLGNGDGTFQTAQNFPAGSEPLSVVIGDFNGDGKPDLAVGDQIGATSVSVLLNQTGVPTTTAVAGPTTSTYGQTVSYTATVTSGGAPVTAGTVTFLDGNTPISPALPVDANGQVTFSLATLNAGSHTLTASYSGTPGTTGFGGSTASTGLTVNPDSTTTVGGSTLDYGQVVTFTATVSANAPRSGTPTGSVDFFDTTTQTDLGSVNLSATGNASLTTALPLIDGSHIITLSYSGDSNFLPSSTTVTSRVEPSIYVLNPTASGALSLSGNATLDIAGGLFVDSTSATAVTTSGNSDVTAANIQVAGDVKDTGHASVIVNPVTGAAAVPDPLAELAAPTGGVFQGAVNLSGNASATINPGIYTQINVSGNAQLILNPGIYVIAGGGFTVSGNAQVSGSGVLIYNAGSNYLDSGNSFGALTVSGRAQVNLTAASTGPYAGIVFFQSRDNTKTIAVTGSTTVGLNGGVLYAPSALFTISGNDQILDASLIVNLLQISGNAQVTDP